MSERDFPDFIDAKDGNVYRVLVCNGRDKPFPLRHHANYEFPSSTYLAACAASDARRVRFDERGLYWLTNEDAAIACDAARKAVGR